MSGGELKSHRFRAEREDDWRRLDRILKKAERGSLSALTDEELVAMPVLYRATLSSLASARATSLDHALTDYLESLCERAYYFLYGVRGRIGERVVRYFSRDLPAAVKAIWIETLIAIGITMVSVVAGYMLVQADPDWFYGLVGGMSQGRDPSATAEELRKAIYDGADAGRDELSVFSTSLFTHNAQIALGAFALGFLFCVPTVYLLCANGLTLGALLAVHFDKGLGFEFSGWLIIHGVTELFAIMLAGAAGMRMGWRVGFPGELGRLDAAREAGRSGAVVIGGVVMMLLFAGLLEGFARQLITSDIARYAIGAVTGVLWIIYYYLPRRSARRG